MHIVVNEIKVLVLNSEENLCFMTLILNVHVTYLGMVMEVFQGMEHEA